jgi:hypothetical protein
MFKRLYVENLSRLARESILSMTTLKELVYGHGINFISVDEGVDSRQENWEILATILCLQHENFIKQLSKYVFRGQEGAILSGYGVGDQCFGYSSEAIPGTEKGRRGKNAVPRRRYTIDGIAVAWVVKIFVWFVVEMRSMTWIARELNRLNAPKDHRSTTKDWYARLVRRVLTNEKYVGYWVWGKRSNFRNPLNYNKIRQDPRSPEEWKKWRRHFPELQIVPNELWEGAQARRKQLDSKPGRPRGHKARFQGSVAGHSEHPCHLLQGLLWCKACEAPFVAGGAGAGYMVCAKVSKGRCTCWKTLRRDLAEREILKVISQEVLTNPDWHGLVLKEMHRFCSAEQSNIPREQKRIESELETKKKAIERLIDKIEEGQAPPEINHRLTQRSAERDELVRQLDQIARATKRVKTLPTAQWLDEQFKHLEGVLWGSDPAAALALRKLVGGKIVLTKVERPGYRRDFLRGRLVLQVSSIINSLGTEVMDATNEKADASAGEGKEVVIDFVEPDAYEDLVEVVKKHWDDGDRHHEIAATVGCSVKVVSRILDAWFNKRGLPPPDYRKHRRQAGRWRPSNKVEPVEFVEAVKALRDRKKSVRQIARELRCGEKRVQATLAQLEALEGALEPQIPNASDNDDGGQAA